MTSLASTPRYQVEARLGAGGMGVVYVGSMVTPAGRRRVALKRLRHGDEADPGQRGRLLVEASLAFRLTHANICQVLDLAESEEGTFVVMEYVPGLDLSALIGSLAARGLRLPIACALFVAREMARALDYAHTRTDEDGRPLRLVHGDVTPTNILLSVEGEAKLTDFGIARALGVAAPGAALRGGTPGFIAPEAIDGASDQRADLYGLGATLAATLAGLTRMEPGRPPAVVAAPSVEGSESLLATIERMTARRPDERYASAAEAEEALSLELARGHPTFTPKELARVVQAETAAVAGNVTGPRQALVSVVHREDGPLRPARQGPPPPATRTVLRRAPSRRWIPASAALLALGAALAWGLVAWSGGRVEPRAPDAAAAALDAGRAALPPPDAGPVDAPAEAPVEGPLPGDAAAALDAATAPPLRPARPAVAYLTVSSAPWGAVYVDDRLVARETPLYRHPVAAGRHRVRVFYPQLGVYSRTVDVTLRTGELRELGFQPTKPGGVPASR